MAGHVRDGLCSQLGSFEATRYFGFDNVKDFTLDKAFGSCEFQIWKDPSKFPWELRFPACKSGAELG